MLAAGRDPGEVMEFLAVTLTNRLMHSPSQRLREAAERGDVEIIRAARELFASRQRCVARLTPTNRQPLASPVD